MIVNNAYYEGIIYMLDETYWITFQMSIFQIGSLSNICISMLNTFFIAKFTKSCSRELLLLFNIRNCVCSPCSENLFY